MKALSLILAAALSCNTQAQAVYFNPLNAVGSGHAALIEFAAWSWASRTGMDVGYAGTTTAGECVPNAVTFRTPILLEWEMAMDAIQATPAERAGFRGFTFVCPYGGYTILLSPHYSVNRVTVLHELGHGLRGFGHLSFSDGAVMRSISDPESLVTTPDIDYILASPDWPLPHAASYCHTEVAPDLDLLVPEAGGKRVRLNYTGLVGGLHTWSTAHALTLGSTKGCTNNTVHPSGDVTLTDIRSLGVSYSSAYIQHVGGGNWKLLTLTP